MSATLHLEISHYPKVAISAGGFVGKLCRELQSSAANTFVSSRRFCLQMLVRSVPGVAEVATAGRPCNFGNMGYHY